MNPNGNKQNLKYPKSTEEAQKWGRAGGINSGVSKRKNKVFTEVIKQMVELKSPKGMNEGIKKAFGLKGVTLKVKDVMVCEQIKKALLERDTQAFNALVDRLDGKPTQHTEVDQKIEHSVSQENIDKVLGALKDSKTNKNERRKD